MSTPIDDGGTAFPVAAGVFHDGRWGMSLRDWFAGQALASGKWIYGRDEREITAAACYEVADAMIAERREKTGVSHGS